MQAKPAYRDRPDAQVAVLDALVERADDGMTVLELRAAVDADIDAIEEALSELKSAGLIRIEREEERTCIRPAPQVVPEQEQPSQGERGLLDALRERLGL